METVQILLIDNSYSSRTIIKRTILNNSDFKILGEAKSKEEGLDFLNKLDINFIILNNNIANKTGFSMAKELLHSNPNLKILFVSIDFLENIDEEIKSLNNIEYFVKEKDFNKELFFQKITKLLSDNETSELNGEKPVDDNTIIDIQPVNSLDERIIDKSDENSNEKDLCDLDSEPTYKEIASNDDVIDLNNKTIKIVSDLEENSEAIVEDDILQNDSKSILSDLENTIDYDCEDESTSEDDELLDLENNLLVEEDPNNTIDLDNDIISLDNNGDCQTEEDLNLFSDKDTVDDFMDFSKDSINIAKATSDLSVNNEDNDSNDEVINFDESDDELINLDEISKNQLDTKPIIDELTDSKDSNSDDKDTVSIDLNEDSELIVLGEDKESIDLEKDDELIDLNKGDEVITSDNDDKLIDLEQNEESIDLNKDDEVIILDEEDELIDLDKDEDSINLNKDGELIPLDENEELIDLDKENVQEFNNEIVMPNNEVVISDIEEDFKFEEETSEDNQSQTIDFKLEDTLEYDVDKHLNEDIVEDIVESVTNNNYSLEEEEIEFNNSSKILDLEKDKSNTTTKNSNYELLNESEDNYNKLKIEEKHQSENEFSDDDLIRITPPRKFLKENITNSSDEEEKTSKEFSNKRSNGVISSLKKLFKK